MQAVRDITHIILHCMQTLAAKLISTAAMHDVCGPICLVSGRRSLTLGSSLIFSYEKSILTYSRSEEAVAAVVGMDETRPAQRVRTSRRGIRSSMVGL